MIAFGLCGSMVIESFSTPQARPLLESSIVVAAQERMHRWLFNDHALMFAGIVLAAMLFPSLVPMICRLIERMPNHLREAAAAAGATQWEMVRFVLLPHIRPRLWSVLMLSLARAMGEGVVVILILGRSEPLASSMASTTHLSTTLATQLLAGGTFAEGTSFSSASTPLLAVCLVALCLGARTAGQWLACVNDPVDEKAAIEKL